MTSLSADERAQVESAARVLRAGGLVAFPTETVYGLGADAENTRAVERVFEVKGRPATHPLIVHLARPDQLGAWAEDVSAAARLLAERFWPGPLTLVLRRSPRVPLAVTGGLETVALRVPAHPTALALLAAFGGGVAAPSANRFGSISPTTARDVREELGDRVDLVVDGGACHVGVESTIVDVSDAEPRILRPGGITREDLESALDRAVPAGAAGSPRVPGQHPSHYAPRARVLLAAPADVVREAARQQALGRRVGVLLPAGERAGAGQEALPVPPSLAEYARSLYDLLREFDRRACDVIVASLPAPEGLGAAIADRLLRAAGPRG